MRLKPEESRRLTQHLVALIFNDNSITIKADRKKIFDAVESELLRHFDEERQIETEAENMLKARESEFALNDRAKALGKIKKQVADQRGFILSGSPHGSRFSEDKIYHLAHLVGDRLFDDDLMDFSDEDEGIKFCKRVFLEYFKQEDQAVDKVRKKVQSLNNAPFEGSREWDILFRKYLEEELNRLGH